MFSPAKTDFINDEPSVSDFQRSAKIVELHPNTPEKSIDISPDNHPTLPEISPDIMPEKTITVAQFCDRYQITSDQFVALRRKASRKFKNLDFTPVREGSRTYWVQQSEILTQMIDEGAIESPKSKPSESAIDAEIVDTQTLSDGSSLVIRKQSYDLALPPLDSPVAREVTYIDVSSIQVLTESLKAEQNALSEVKELTELTAHANRVAQKKAQFDLIEALINQGYTAEQAVAIAKGVNK
jgi:hypothetical protein